MLVFGPKNVILQKVNRLFVKSIPNIAHFCPHKYAVGQISTANFKFRYRQKKSRGKSHCIGSLALASFFGHGFLSISIFFLCFGLTDHLSQYFLTNN